MSLISALATGYAALSLGGGDPVYPGFGPDQRPQAFTQLVPSGGDPLPFRLPDADLLTITLQVNTWTADSHAGTAWDRAAQAYAALHERTNWDLTGFRVLQCQCMQVPFFAGAANGRVKVTFNLRLTARVVPIPDPDPEE